MYVILEAGGKQYKLAKDDVFVLNRMPGKKESMVKLKNVLFARERQSYFAGAPHIKDAYVTCEILAHPRADKVVAFKYKRRKSYKRKIGHRQDLTMLKVKEIHLGNSK